MPVNKREKHVVEAFVAVAVVERLKGVLRAIIGCELERYVTTDALTLTGEIVDDQRITGHIIRFVHTFDSQAGALCCGQPTVTARHPTTIRADDLKRSKSAHRVFRSKRHGRTSVHGLVTVTGFGVGEVNQRTELTSIGFPTVAKQTAQNGVGLVGTVLMHGTRR